MNNIKLASLNALKRKIDAMESKKQKLVSMRDGFKDSSLDKRQSLKLFDSGNSTRNVSIDLDWSMGGFYFSPLVLASSVDLLIDHLAANIELAQKEFAKE